MFSLDDQLYIYILSWLVFTYPEVGGCKSGWSRDIGGGGGVGVEGIDVGQQGAHHCRHPWQHVLRGQARELAEQEKKCGETGRGERERKIEDINAVSRLKKGRSGYGEAGRKVGKQLG